MLAYSGGLDTSVALRWLAEEYGAEVVALLVDVGQGIDREAVTRRAMAAGAADVVIADAREEFAHEFVLPILQAGALYEGRYPLVSALSRPLIARHLVAVAREVGATAVAHGCTGKGNDQVRFETAVAALAPDLAVLAPVRDWGMTREQEIAYAERHGIEVPVKSGAAYSIDQNLWGRSIEAGPSRIRGRRRRRRLTRSRRRRSGPSTRRRRSRSPSRRASRWPSTARRWAWSS